MYGSDGPRMCKSRYASLEGFDLSSCYSKGSG